MKELIVYREKLIVRLAEAVEEFREACEAFGNPFKSVEDGWTLHQIAAHMRDVDKAVYGARIRRTLEEEKPEFTVFNADTWMAEHYNRDEPLSDILGEFSAHAADLCATLQALPREAWSRESSHETMGSGMTLQLWVERNLAHIEEHLKTLKNAKNG